MPRPQCSVLVVSSSEQGVSLICKLLDITKYSPVTILKSAGEARRRLISSSFDVVIINAPLSDEFGHELAMSTVDSSSGTIIIAKNQVSMRLAIKWRN